MPCAGTHGTVPMARAVPLLLTLLLLGHRHCLNSDRLQTAAVKLRQKCIEDIVLLKDIWKQRRFINVTADMQ